MYRRQLLATVGSAATVGVAGCVDDDAEWRDGDGLNAEVLATRHVESAIDAGSVTLLSTADTSHDGETEPSPWLPSQEYEAAYDLNTEQQYLRQELTEGSEPDVSELYVADEEAFFREQRGDEIQYDRQAVGGTAADLEAPVGDCGWDPRPTGDRRARFGADVRGRR